MMRLLPEKVSSGKNAVVAALEATLRSPEGSDGSARNAQTHEKGSRAGVFILRGGLKDWSHARGCCVGAACRSPLDRRRGSLTPPCPTSPCSQPPQPQLLSLLSLSAARRRIPSCCWNPPSMPFRTFWPVSKCELERLGSAKRRPRLG